MKFRKKPVVIDAVQWDGNNLKEITEFMQGSKVETPCRKAEDAWDDYVSTIASIGLKIKTLEGEMHADYNDWIIKGVAGEFYPCKPDIFELTYEEVKDD